jgi:hypothetical protein
MVPRVAKLRDFVRKEVKGDELVRALVGAKAVADPPLHLLRSAHGKAA